MAKKVEDETELVLVYARMYKDVVGIQSPARPWYIY